MHGLRPPESRAMGGRRAHLLLSKRLVGPISSLIRRHVLRTRSSSDSAHLRPPPPPRPPLYPLSQTGSFHGSLEVSVCVRTRIRGRVIVLLSLLKDKPFYLR